jgi:hypothetical protein
LWLFDVLKSLIPKDEDDVWICVAVLMVAYIVLSYLINRFSTTPAVESGKVIFDRAFNGATFAGSAILLLGIFKPEVLKAIGSLKGYLLFASVAGISYSIRALFPW